VRRAEHAAVARMSRRGQHRIAEQSGHHIQIEQPDLVTGAIRQIIGMK
jgi:pimeloyl-ACP methyl ester carboxylesterase